jgi:hypothetical protein
MEEKGITYDDIEIMDSKELGSGYISRVKLAKHKKSRQLFAVKIVR